MIKKLVLPDTRSWRLCKGVLTEMGPCWLHKAIPCTEQHSVLPRRIPIAGRCHRALVAVTACPVGTMQDP